MEARRAIQRSLSPSLFALICLCFFLPFGTVNSCDTTATTSFSGVQLVTHTVPRGGALDKTRRSEDVSVWVEHHFSFPATVALAAALIGFALGLFGVARGPGLCAAAVLSELLWLLARFGNWGVDVRWGYGLALFFAALTSAVHADRAWRRWTSYRQGKVVLW